MGSNLKSGARVSSMASGIIGSEILAIAGDVRARMARGETVCNLTVGDFSPTEFRVPRFLQDAIEEALRAGETNYPPPDGMPAFREAIRDFVRRRMGFEVPLEAVLVTSGSRPGIYGTYITLVDPGDRVVYPVPSWNNNHYVQMMGAEGVPVPCTAEDDFLPTRAMLEPHIRGARLLALASPLNPTGTCFTADALGEICDMVLEENRRRGPGERPLYLMYDQVYWMLTFGETRHVDPISLRPEMAEYTVLVDGISKSFAATGLRVGWVVGPPDVIRPMSSILTHAGTWAPRPEQVATTRLLSDDARIDAFHAEMKPAIQTRLDALFQGIARLREAGFPVEAITPMGAIYLSARFALHGMRTPSGTVLETDEQIRSYLLEAAGVAVVPFQAFGAAGETGWCRLSAGAVSPESIATSLGRLEEALRALSR